MDWLKVLAAACEPISRHPLSLYIYIYLQYEFVADHEFPTCTRSRELLTKACSHHGLAMDVIHVATVGSVAMRQLRVCIDFRVSPQR